VFVLKLGVALPFLFTFTYLNSELNEWLLILYLLLSCAADLGTFSHRSSKAHTHNPQERCEPQKRQEMRPSLPLPSPRAWQCSLLPSISGCLREHAVFPITINQNAFEPNWRLSKSGPHVLCYLVLTTRTYTILISLRPILGRGAATETFFTCRSSSGLTHLRDPLQKLVLFPCDQYRLPQE